MNRARSASGKGSPPAVAAAAALVAAEALLARFECALPALVVFDLDYTLWPYWCETMSAEDSPWLYPQARPILRALEQRGIQLALASRTPTPTVAAAFLEKLSLRERFCSIQLIPAADGFDSVSAQKDVMHLPAIQAETGVPNSQMLFFDDEHPNIRKVARLGVTSILVDTSSGVCLQSLERGLKAFADAKQAADS